MVTKEEASGALANRRKLHVNINDDENTGLQHTGNTSKDNKKIPEDPEARIRVLEAQFRKDNLKYINNLVDLINLIAPDQQFSPKAIHAVRRVIKILENAPASTLRSWLSARRAQYAEVLENVIMESTQNLCIEAAVAAAALTHADVWRSLLCKAIPSGNKEINRLVQHFVTRFGDLRLTALQLAAESIGSVQTRLDILSKCCEPTGDFARDEVSQKDIRKAFTAAWLAILREELAPATLQEILKRIPTELIPNMRDPLCLADFLTACYNDTSNVSTAILALDGLFLLISRHKLDYPLFYPKLYALMTEETLFHAEGREKFLELSAMFLLKGGMLPGGMVAAFVKRLVRRALMAPPAGALWCLRLALDLMYRHPNITYLIHRSVNLFDSDVPAGSKRKRTSMSDPFNDAEPSPQKSCADESSLWELQLLAVHVSPAVSRLVIAFSKDIRSKTLLPPGSLTDYIGLNFDDLFQAETKRKTKSSHLAYEAPGTAPRLAQLDDRLRVSVSWT